jgi:hypothetical protein
MLATVVTLAVAVDAGAATRAQYGKKCSDAWTGKHGTKAYRTYKKGCIKAAIAATAAARTAGNNDNTAADRSRAVAACRVSFPAPRNTKTKRAAYKACIAAAVAAQKVYGGRPLKATLTGGTATTDADGAGTAAFTLNQGHGQLCYDVSWTGLDAVTALHIHLVANGSIVVPLDADTTLTDGNAKGCQNGLTKKLIAAIRQHPENYYINVHTTLFPLGAISGTLHK